MLGLKTAQPGHFGGVGCQLMPPMRKSRAPMAKPMAKRMTRLRVPLSAPGMSKLTLGPRAGLGRTCTSCAAPSRRSDRPPRPEMLTAQTPSTTRADWTDLRTTHRQPADALSSRRRICCACVVHYAPPRTLVRSLRATTGRLENRRLYLDTAAPQEGAPVAGKVALATA